MSFRSPRAILTFVLLLLSPLLAAEDVRITAGAVEDQRSSDQFGGLSIELVLQGGGIEEVRAVRVRLKSAKDDVGSVLYKANRDEGPKDFEEFSAHRQPGLSVSLSSPRRDASTVDVSGEIELFIPTLDPNTRQKLAQFLSRLDKPIANPVLKSARVEITPLSPGQYRIRQQKDRAGTKAMASPSAEEPSENSVLLETKDPDGRIASIDVVAADGTELRAPSRTSSGGRESKLVKIDLSEKLPPDAALLVTLRTAKSLVTVPLNLRKVSLP